MKKVKVGKFVIITKKEYDDLMKDRHTLKIIRSAEAEKARINRKRYDNEEANRILSSAIKELNYIDIDC